MNVCVAHLGMNVCVAKNFGAWNEKVGHPWTRRHFLLQNVYQVAKLYSRVYIVMEQNFDSHA